jgi:hypothetical protein
MGGGAERDCGGHGVNDAPSRLQSGCNRRAGRPTVMTDTAASAPNAAPERRHERRRDAHRSACSSCRREYGSGDT